MKRIGIIFIKLSAWGAMALILTIIWWRMWFYHGWMGSPQYLPKIMGEGGEGYYGNVMIEMFLISLIIILLIFLTLMAVLKYLRKSG